MKSDLFLPEKLVESVKKGTDNLPWVINEEKQHIVIPFGRVYDKEKGNLTVKKYEILLGIKEFYEKYLIDPNPKIRDRKEKSGEKDESFSYQKYPPTQCDKCRAPFYDPVPINLCSRCRYLFNELKVS